MKFLSLFAFIYFINITNCFIPAAVLSNVIFKLEKIFGGNLGKVSESLVHDEIMKRGITQSVVNYLYEQSNGTTKLDLGKMEKYYDLRVLYFDYYGF